MMIDGLRQRLSSITFALAFVLIAIFASEFVLFHFLDHASKPFLMAHPAIWSYRNGKAEIKVFLRTWMAAIGILALAFFGSGTKRKTSLLLNSSAVVGIPTFLYIATSAGF